MTRSFTFYSYKGGSGRTTVLLNTVRHLVRDLKADSEHPILLVDADLESAGLTFYFETENKFKGLLSTDRVFEHPGDIFTRDETPVIFGEDDSARAYIDCKDSGAWKKLKELDNYDTENDIKISQMFSDISLPGKYFILLKNYLDEMLKSVKDAETLFSYRIRTIIRPMFVLKDAMRELSKTCSDPEDLSKKKSEILQEFLPSRSFIDVSKYFSGDTQLPPGTVRFLGTNVSNESRVSRNNATTCINTLVDKCEEHGYRAVLFDSGSGTQASAYMLHHVSDVIVYCMRPTIQFIKGTKDNIYRFEDELMMNMEINPRENGGKPIILFPNAVPCMGEDDPFRLDAFEQIQDIAKRFPSFVDDTFCTYENSLHEVSLFKWHEKILGCTDYHLNPKNNDLNKEIERYSHDELPEDVKSIYAAYGKLSERLRDNY